MKKQQTFISYLENSEGKMINFERWNYKRVNTIIEKLQWLYSHTFYKSELEKATYIAIYATPNGYDKDPQPIYKEKISNFFKS